MLAEAGSIPRLTPERSGAPGRVRLRYEAAYLAARPGPQITPLARSSAIRQARSSS